MAIIGGKHSRSRGRRQLVRAHRELLAARPQMRRPGVALGQRGGVGEDDLVKMADLPGQAMVAEGNDPGGGELAEEEHVLADHADLVRRRLELEQGQEVAVALGLGMRLERVEYSHVEQQQAEAEMRARLDQAASALARVV